MAFVIMRASLDLTRAEGQHRLCAIQCLDLGFLINRQHDGVIRRVQIKPDDIDDLIGKMRIVADLERLQTMGFKVGSGPDLSHLPSRNGGIFGHQAHTPMRRLTRHALGCQRKNFLHFLSAELARLATSRQVIQALKTGLQIALAPFEHHRRPDLQLMADVFGG